MNDAIKKLLERTALTIPLPAFLQVVENTYPQVGKILATIPIVEGYEAANFILQCQKGKYVLKIFEQKRNPENINALVSIVEQATAIGVPTLKLVSGKQGNLSSYQAEKTKVFFYLTEYWEGENYESKTPSIQEMLEITELLAKLNTLDFPVVEEYDSWGNKNLVREYEKKFSQISSDVKEQIADVVASCRVLQFEGFSKGVIHGDMQRKHVLRNRKGDYCILDFGCMSNDYKVIDLSTYLAWFCLAEDTWDRQSTIITDVIERYTKIHSMSASEIESLPILIRAAYASYFLKTSQLISDGDDSEETKEWNQSAKNLLILSKDL